ncbi:MULTISPECIES: DUF3560 domain-containing protein [Streptomyces]|uniref:DUF3560 domain-containing protein n=2 Tax=Streptomyces TaxID=1883 RepID=A0ABU4JZJ9_9ACTN|nr:DUF3560 domain-containing protein [Streptomyces roseolus]MDX2290928.1 DUF3560 domain-containing protein [Streptomyces roseolus]
MAPNFSGAEAEREARADARAKRFEELASRAAGASEAAFASARRIGSAIPFGQPVPVGHHSEHRRGLARIDSGMRKGFEQRAAPNGTPSAPTPPPATNGTAPTPTRSPPWRKIIAQAEADKVKLWSRADFTKGDYARSRGRWYEVLRVNAVSLTVPGGPDIQPVINQQTRSWDDRIPYDAITGRMSAEDMTARLTAKS